MSGPMEVSRDPSKFMGAHQNRYFEDPLYTDLWQTGLLSYSRGESITRDVIVNDKSIAQNEGE